MSRLAATLRLDARLQARNNVYAIIGVAAVLLGVPLRVLFTPEQLHFFMPLVALSGVSLTTFFLVGILLLLERTEGTLDIVLVSPLRPVEYLASKMLTVTGIALAECLLLVGIVYGLDYSPTWLLLAVVLRSGVVAAAGVAIGVRYRSITHFLFPAVGVALVIDLPVLGYLGLLPMPLFTLWPSLPSLLFAKAAFLPVEPGALFYALVYGVVAVGLAVLWALRCLDRFVVRGEAS